MKNLSKIFLCALATTAILTTTCAAVINGGHANFKSASAADNVGSYYSSISDSLTGTELRDALNTLNSSKKSKNIGYDGFRYFAAKSDIDPNGTSNKIVGFYDNELVGPNWDSGNTWNREHVWPKSRKGSNVENDAHMVRPAKVSSNGERGNLFYAASGAYDPGKFVASYRGIAARIIFYCAIADKSLTIIDATTDSSTNGTMGKLSDLLKWNLEYLPNTSSSAPIEYRVEQNRNNVIASSQGQGNRNPFIDHPEYACKIWGDTNNETRRICGSGGDVPPVPPVPPEPDNYVKHAGTETDPYSVTNALEKIGVDEAEHYVVGQVVADATKGTSGDYKFDLTDGEKSIFVYYAKPNDLALPTKGQYVTVKGKLADYNGTKEVKDGTMIAIDSSYPTGWTLKESGSGGGGGNEGGDTPGKGKGCGGSIIATSALITVTSVAGLFLALNRRRKQD